MRLSLPNNLLVLGALVWALLGLGDDSASKVQSQIEQEIKAILGEQLASGEYFVFAVVTANGGETAAGGEGAGSPLPYSPVSVSQDVLQRILEKSYAKGDLESVKIEVTVGFDERLPEAKRKLLEDILRKRFGFDGTNRILNVQSLELVTPALGESARFELERAKFQSEQARLELEAERSKLELKKKELELEQAGAKKPDGTPADPSAAAPTPERIIERVFERREGEGEGKGNQAAMQLSPTFEIFKDFQLTAIALVLGIIMVVGILVGGSFFVKGLAPISTAIESIGTSVENAAKLSAPSSSQVTVTTPEDKSSGESAGAAMPGGGHTAEVPSAIDEEFMAKVQDKIEVLTAERNFSFFRIFTDMIQTKPSLPYAAAILVSLDSETARSIIKDISVDDIAKLKTYLSTEGALAKAKELKPLAMTDFYGRIAMEEFLESPLMALKDLRWLTRMTTAEMGKFVLSLSDTERTAFLACLSPERTKKLIEVLPDGEGRELLLKSLAAIDAVTETDLKATLESLSQRMSGATDGGADKPRSAVDSAKYLAAIASDLTGQDQAKLFDALSGKGQLLSGIREHFVPFNVVAKLPKELITEIFGDRPDNQIARILFDSSEEVRAKVISAFPEIRAESVKDELRVLDEDSFYAKRNRQQSAKLQKEIARYLLRLSSEGLLNVEQDASPVTGGLNESAA